MINRDDSPICLVATPGGHLHELFELVQRLPEYRTRVWLTPQTAQSTGLLSDEEVEFVPPVGSRQLGRTLRSFPRAVSLIRRLRPHAVLSTGAALCLPYLITARAHGIPVIYVESVTRIDGPSLTGRLLERVPGVRLHHQGFRSPASRWKYVGSSLDSFSSRPSAAPIPVRRILVTLGSERFPFQRLVDTLSSSLPRDLEVVWQTGHTPVPSDLPGRVEAWLPYEEMMAEIDRADAVITHAGVGSVLASLSRGVVPVVMARSARRGEHIDDHQADLTQQLIRRSLAVDLDGKEVTDALAEAASCRAGRHHRVQPLQLM